MNMRSVYNDIIDEEISNSNITEITPICTSIAEVEVNPAITETNAFQNVLREIPLRISDADKLLEDYRSDPDNFLKNINEDKLDESLKQMKDVSVFVRDVEKARKEIKSYMNGVRDNILENLDSRLESARYGELERAQSDIKQLKKDVNSDRMASRWEEIKRTFIANINRYPLIDEFAPELTDFSKFKMIHHKLISGAKTRVVKDGDHVYVNEVLFNWNTGIELMIENSWGLSVSDLNSLLTFFKQDPTIETIEREARQIKANTEAREKAMIEAKERKEKQDADRIIAEAKRKEELAKIEAQKQEAKKNQDKKAEEQAKIQIFELEKKAELAKEQEKKQMDEFNQFGGQYRTIFKESFPKFIEYLFTNEKYHAVHSNPAIKATVIYDIMHQVDNSNSVVFKETSNDPQKVLDLVRYILDA